MSKACAGGASEKVVAAVSHIRRSLSVGLQRLNARILLSHADPKSEVFTEPVSEPARSCRLCVIRADILEIRLAPTDARARLEEVVRLTCRCGFLDEGVLLEL